ncbi:MAG: ATP-binding protein [bacterium]|nr:ATP-binding protein [bacterium]
MMLYPISQGLVSNRSFYKMSMAQNPQIHNSIAFRKDAPLQKSKDEKQLNSKQKLLLAVAVAYFASATIIALRYFPLLMKDIKGSAKNKVDSGTFRTLEDDEKIPTLETCKSINNKLKEILETKIAYRKADKKLIVECGMPKSSNRFLFYGDPGNGKSFFAKIYAKSIGAEYKEITAADYERHSSGESIEKLCGVFEEAIKVGKEHPDKDYVLIMNEADQLIFSSEKLKDTRGGYGFFKIEERDIFINYIDRLQEEAPNVTFIGTVNFTPTDGALDRAVLSRFSKNIVEVPYPEACAFYEAMKKSLSNLPNYEDLISKNGDKLFEIAKNMEKRKCSFRNMDNIMDNAKNTNLKNRINNPQAQFDIKYIADALDGLKLTDGEISEFSHLK